MTRAPDEDGRGAVRRPVKDLIISGGINISPVELEIAIGAIDGVQGGRCDRGARRPVRETRACGDHLASPDVDEKAVIEHRRRCWPTSKCPATW